MARDSELELPGMKLGTFGSLRPPPGVDLPRQPPVFLAAGDRVCIEVEGFGGLTNLEEVT